MVSGMLHAKAAGLRLPAALLFGAGAVPGYRFYTYLCVHPRIIRGATVDLRQAGQQDAESHVLFFLFKIIFSDLPDLLRLPYRTTDSSTSAPGQRWARDGRQWRLMGRSIDDGGK